MVHLIGFGDNTTVVITSNEIKIVVVSDYDVEYVYGPLNLISEED